MIIPIVKHRGVQGMGRTLATTNWMLALRAPAFTPGGFPARHLAVMLGAFSLAAGAGCRQEPSPPPAPAATKPAVSTPAQPPPAELASRTPTTSAPSAPAHSVPRPPLGRDHPNAPAFLPDDNVIGAWNRTKAADVVSPAGLKAVIREPALLAAVSPFHIKQATTCAYAWIEHAAQLDADLLLIEAESQLDAMGLLTVHCLAADNARPGTVNRVQKDSLTYFYLCQGNYFIQMHTPQTEEVFLDRCAVFLQKLILRIPSDEPPLWTKLLPTEGRLPGHFWIVRKVRSLRGTSGRILPLSDHDTLDQLLGLDERSALAVAAYRVPDEAKPNVLWLAVYPDPDQARAAYDRYSAFLKRSDTPDALNTLLEPAHGRFLLGSWSADQESITHMLPAVATNLP